MIKKSPIIKLINKPIGVLNMTDKKSQFIIRCKNKPNLFFKEQALISGFCDVAFVDIILWGLMFKDTSLSKEKKEFYDNRIFSYDTKEEAERGLFDFLQYLKTDTSKFMHNIAFQDNGYVKQDLSNDFLEIVEVKASISTNVVKVYSFEQTENNKEPSTMKAFEEYFVGTSLGKKMSVIVEDMKKERKDNYKGYYNECYDKHYRSWLKLNA